MLKMIIADDEKNIRESLKNCIDWENLGINLIGLCKNGLEAYDVIIDESPDIVLTDIKMPALSGLELIKRITQIGQHVEFIIVSGYGEFSYAKEAMKYGIKHYLLKPYNQEELISVIEEAIKNCNQWLESLLQKNYNVRMLDSYANTYNNLDEIESFLKTIHEPELLKTALTNLFLHISKKQGGIQYYVLEYLAKLYSLNDMEEIRSIALENVSLILSENTTINTGKPFIDRTIQYVYDHLSNPELSLKFIAETQLFMNVDYLSKQFVKHVGCKFSYFLAKARIEEAKRLLLQKPDLSIQEAADAVGCGNNPQYFSLLFKKVTGQTATEYMKKMRNKS